MHRPTNLALSEQFEKEKEKKNREVTVQICIVSSFHHIYMTLSTVIVNMQISYCCGTAHEAVVRRTVQMGKVHR